jgi:hypothetical protein
MLRLLVRGLIAVLMVSPQIAEAKDQFELIKTGLSLEQKDHKIIATLSGTHKQLVMLR